MRGEFCVPGKRESSREGDVRRRKALRMYTRGLEGLDLRDDIGVQGR